MADETDYQVWRYQEKLPADKENLESAFALLESYGGIPRSRVEEHVRAVRENAWAVFPYACIGRWRFLDLYLPSTPYYPRILHSLASDTADTGVFIDVGCCFGQILRQLVADGVSPSKLVGVDLRPEFIELGYELFQDRDHPPAKFVTADLLSDEDEARELNGTARIVHAASVFHLFGWEDQVKLGVRVAGLFRPDGEAVVYGRQVGSHEPKDVAEHAALGLGRYHHDLDTWQTLWDEVGHLTETKWKIEGEMIDLIPDSEVKRTGIRFAVKRLSVSGAAVVPRSGRTILECGS